MNNPVYSNKRKIFLTVLFMAVFSTMGFAQSFVLDLQYNPMSFTNNARTVIYDPGHNGGISQGAIHRYDNVVTVNGITVYAYLTLLEVKDADIRNFDDDVLTGDRNRFQPRIGSKKNNKDCYVRYQLEFFNAANDQPVFLYHYWLTGVDIDGSSSYNGYREYVEASGYTSYQVDASTMLTVSTNSSTGETRFEGRRGSLDGVTFDNTAAFIANYSNPNNKITFSLGITKEKVTERYFSLQFGAPDPDGPFDHPVTTQNPLPLAVDDIGTTINTLTGGVSVNNVLDNDLYDGSAINPSTVKISLIAPASNNGVHLNTSTGKVTVDQGTPVGTYTLTYQISLVDDPSATDLANVTVQVIRVQADLAITKSASLNTVNPGQTFTYTISVVNNGPDPATNVSIADVLPSSLNLISASPSKGTWNAPNWSIGNLANNATATLTLSVSVKNSAESGTLSNTATISSNTYDPNSENNSATSNINIHKLSADLSITKTAAQESVYPGEEIRYIITVTNNGPDEAVGVKVTDNLPATVDFKNTSTVTGSWSAPTWSVGNLAKDASAVLYINVTAKEEAIGTLSNSASVTSTTNDPTTTNNSATVQVAVLEPLPSADLQITKTASTNTTLPGQTFSYTISVKNNGPDAAASVNVQDVLPAALTLVSTDPSVGNWNAPNWVIGNLANDATATLTLNVSVKNSATPGSVSNTATITSTTSDPNTDNNTSTKAVTIQEPVFSADLEITKTASKSSVIPGEAFTYTISVKNNGPDAATGVNIEDILPASLNFSSANPSVGSWSAPNWNIGNLANNATATLTLSVSVKNSAEPGTLSNTATVSSNTGDPDTENNSATKTIQIMEPQAIVNHYPASGYGTLAFEDLWPGKGDYDFNDLVLDYQFEIVTNNNNNVDQLKGTFIIKAFGATLENGFGFQLSNNLLASDLTVSGYSLRENYIHLNANGTEANQSKPTIIVYDNAYKQMAYPGVGIGVNTDPTAPYVTPDTIKIVINFPSNKYSFNDLDIAHFNPFIIVNKDRGVEVHLPDYPPTDLADQGIFRTYDDDSSPARGKYYKTVNNLPWAINIYENFDYPSEKKDITWTHLKFAKWATSGGVEYPNWYQDIAGYRNNSNIYRLPF